MGYVTRAQKFKLRYSPTIIEGYFLYLNQSNFLQAPNHPLPVLDYICFKWQFYKCLKFNNLFISRNNLINGIKKLSI